MNEWIAEAGRDKKGPLFRSMSKDDSLREEAMSRFDVLHMIKRRAKGRRPALFYAISSDPA